MKLFWTPQSQRVETREEIRGVGPLVAVCPHAPLIAVGGPARTVQLHKVRPAPWVPRRAMAARDDESAARDDEEEDKPAEVTVYYATSRQRKELIDGAALMRGYFLRFFATGHVPPKDRCGLLVVEGAPNFRDPQERQIQLLGPPPGHDNVTRASSIHYCVKWLLLEAGPYAPRGAAAGSETSRIFRPVAITSYSITDLGTQNPGKIKSYSVPR